MGKALSVISKLDVEIKPKNTHYSCFEVDELLPSGREKNFGLMPAKRRTKSG